MLIQYIKHEKHAVEEVRVVDAIRKCDICGKEITGPHFELLSFHSGWWNNPIDSTRIMDCCDSSCLRKAVDMYLIGIETNPGTNLRISYKMEAISSRDLSMIDKDAEQRMGELTWTETADGRANMIRLINMNPNISPEFKLKWIFEIVGGNDEQR